MKWQGRRQSNNVEDRRGMSSGGKTLVGGGIIGIIILLVNIFGGENAQFITPVLEQMQGSQPNQTEAAAPLSKEDEEMGNFVRVNLADNEDIGDFTDVLEGRDITVTTAGPESTGTPYNKSTIMPDMKVSPLHKDAKLVEKWLDEQPNPIDQFTKYSYDEIMGFLTTWLTADDSEAETEEEEVEIKPTKSSGKIKDLFKEG